MSVFLGSNQIGSINLTRLPITNTDLENSLINRTISLYNNEISYIKPGAFGYCNNFTLADFSNCSYIGSYAFRNCSNLTSANFPSCTSIGGYAFGDCINLSSISFPNCSYIESCAFRSCSNLTLINFSNCSYIGSSAFRSCPNLTSADFSSCSYIGSYAFYECTNLTLVNFPNCSYVGSCAFAYCGRLTSMGFPNCSYIENYAFSRCYRLLSLYLIGSSIPSLNDINAFDSTPISNYTTLTGGVYGSIYVPASLYSSYITTTNWSVYSSRIAGMDWVSLISNDYEVKSLQNNLNALKDFTYGSFISAETLKITLNNTEYTCSKQDVSTETAMRYAYGWYGSLSDEDVWSDYSFCFTSYEDRDGYIMMTLNPDVFEAYINISVKIEELSVVLP